MYSSERNVQMLLSLLKAHKIKKMVLSPGSANASFVASAQYDGDFELYSSVDERSAAYIACGLAEESQRACCDLLHWSYSIKKLYARIEQKHTIENCLLLR